MLKSRRSAWQRLCVICMEPYAMNGFWCKHGGANSRGVSTDLQIRSNGHKSCMRRLAANGKKEIENFEDAVHLEKLWMTLAMEDKIDGDTAEISNVVLLKHFPDDKAVIDASVESGIIPKPERSSSIGSDKIKGVVVENVSVAVKETTTTIPTNGTKKRKRDDSVVPLVPVIPVIEGVVIEKSRTLSDDKKITLAATRIRTGEWKEQT